MYHKVLLNSENLKIREFRDDFCQKFVRFYGENSNEEKAEKSSMKFYCAIINNIYKSGI